MRVCAEQWLDWLVVKIAPLDQQFILGILFALPGEVQCAVQVSLFNWFALAPPVSGILA